MTFPDATPVDGSEASATASVLIAARVKSRRTVMGEVGIEEPNEELKRIVVEDMIFQLVDAPAAIQTDANVAAKAGFKGTYAAETVAGGSNAGGDAGVPPTPGTPPAATPSDDMAALIDEVEAILDAEAQDQQDDAQEALTGRAGTKEEN